MLRMKYEYLPDREYGFTRVINECNYKIGIEIGVRNAHYSVWLLKHTNLVKLYSLDQTCFHDTLQNLRPFGERSEFVNDRSPQAASRFPDEFFDFIYIDAGHSYNDVYNDMNGWWQKLRHGGMFCGDDYTHVHNPGEGVYGVVEAVNKFCEENNLTYCVTGAGINSKAEKERVARGMGKVIEKALKREVMGIRFGESSDADDIRIPQWFLFKE